MVHKLRKIEGGLALVLDASELKAAGFGEETPLTVSVSGGEILVQIAQDSDEFEKGLAEFNRLYPNMLRRLAE